MQSNFFGVRNDRNRTKSKAAQLRDLFPGGNVGQGGSLAEIHHSSSVIANSSRLLPRLLWLSLPHTSATGMPHAVLVQSACALNALTRIYSAPLPPAAVKQLVRVWHWVRVTYPMHQEQSGACKLPNQFARHENTVGGFVRKDR